MEKLPKILYKYRVWRDKNDDKNSYKFHRELLTKRRIYFSSPKDFNDPFDCKILFSYDISNKTLVKEKIIKTLSDLNQELSNDELNNLAQKRIEEIYTDESKFKREVKQKQIDRINNTIGIYSLSAIKNNILMWSHYSLSHKGFCVGLSVDKLQENRNNFSRQKGLFYGIKKINYSKKYPILHALDFHKDDVLQNLTSKYSDWIYEKEHRLMVLNIHKLSNGQRRGVLPKNTFKEVIFGSEMCTKHKEEIKKVLRKEKFEVDLYQAKKKERSFGLDFEKISY